MDLTLFDNFEIIEDSEKVWRRGQAWEGWGDMTYHQFPSLLVPILTIPPSWVPPREDV